MAVFASVGSVLGTAALLGCCGVADCHEKRGFLLLELTPPHYAAWAWCGNPYEQATPNIAAR